MSRLIDADALIKELHEALNGSGYDTDYKEMGIDDFILNQPTAFDVDKVVEVLEELKHNYEENCNSRIRKGLCAKAEDCGSCAFMQSIEIVRKGGVHE